jgi:hypothetical protein
VCRAYHAPMEQSTTIAEGAKRAIDGVWRVYHGGYWIKAYEAPADTLTAKKRLIEALTRRLFNHVEHGLNIPGVRLEEARRAFQTETDRAKRRVKGAMLAGALFNRATDVFTKAVELQALGVDIRPDNALVRQCGELLQEALTLGKMVLHCSGEEGIDELWGEPFKAFVFPIEDFYRSRYVKIAMTFRDIDRLTDELCAHLASGDGFAGAEPLLRHLGRVAKIKCETLHTDPEIFDVWAEFVTAVERVAAFQPCLPQRASLADLDRAAQGRRLLIEGKELIFHITRARVPMPKSTAALIERLRQFADSCRRAIPVVDDSGRAVVLVSPQAPDSPPVSPGGRVSVLRSP